MVTLYNYLCTNNIPEKILKIKRILLICVSMILLLTFPVKWLINNYIIKYKESSNIIFILFAAQFFSIIVRCIYNNLYKSEKKQNRYFKIMIGITIFAIISDVLFYRISKTNEAFAFATLLTSIVWFIIGEVDFDQYRYKINDYIFIGIICITYLITGLIVDNAIIGCCIYVGVLGITVLIFLKKEFRYLVEEGKNILRKLKEKLI